MKPVVIVGAGGHGREILDVFRSIEAAGSATEVTGFVDDSPTHLERLERLGVPLLGDLDHLARSGGDYVLGIGTSAARRKVVERLGSGCTPVGAVHPGASIGADCTIGVGVVIFERSIVTTNVTIGDHTHLNVACAVQHDSVVGDFVQFSPGVLVNGDCGIGDDVFLGSGAIVTRGVAVGDGSRVGAGAVVLSDVSPGTTVLGVPAR